MSPSSPAEFRCFMSLHKTIKFLVPFLRTLIDRSMLVHVRPSLGCTGPKHPAPAKAELLASRNLFKSAVRAGSLELSICGGVVPWKQVMVVMPALSERQQGNQHAYLSTKLDKRTVRTPIP